MTTPGLSSLIKINNNPLRDARHKDEESNVV